MGDLVCARIFVSKPLGIEFFPLTTKPWHVFPCKMFFTLEISLQDIFSEITHKFVIIRLICSPGTSKFQNMRPVPFTMP